MTWRKREIEALKLALEALEEHDYGVAQIIIREALAQPEPVEKFCDSNCVWTDHHPDCKLAQRTWVGLTDEEIQTTWDSVMDGSVFTRREVYKAIEAKLKEKNT
jgi:hypothetical protein